MCFVLLFYEGKGRTGGTNGRARRARLSNANVSRREWAEGFYEGGDVLDGEPALFGHDTSPVPVARAMASSIVLYAAQREHGGSQSRLT